MTELETIQRAKMYLDKLANGIDPLTDREIPAGDTVNNARISRCFFFVSEVLGRVIENGGVTAPKRASGTGKLPFSLPFEKRAAFPFSDEPIGVTEIARRLTALADDGDRTAMKYAAITGWLLELGLLAQQESQNGRKSNLPTAGGAELGIFTEDREGVNGLYRAVLYQRSAQQFILDNLDAILEWGSSKANTQRSK